MLIIRVLSVIAEMYEKFVIIGLQNEFVEIDDNFFFITSLTFLYSRNKFKMSTGIDGKNVW